MEFMYSNTLINVGWRIVVEDEWTPMAVCTSHANSMQNLRRQRRILDAEDDDLRTFELLSLQTVLFAAGVLKSVVAF